MEEQKEKVSFWDKFKSKYRLSIYRDETFEEVLNIKLTRLNVVTIVGLGIIIFLVIVISIIAYTPARELIPGYPDKNTVRDIHLNYYRLDSLEAEIYKRDVYFENLRLIISGEKPPEYAVNNDTTGSMTRVITTSTVEDSVLRSMIASTDQYSLSFMESNNGFTSLSSVLFFPPVRGMVTNHFNSLGNHYGTDIVAGPNEVVKSILAGTVILTSWTLETGHVIQIQHSNNLVSVYKHNAELLKHMGDRVKPGEPIAIIGNSGELTTGPHLHFEMWYNGTPLDPEDYITF